MGLEESTTPSSWSWVRLQASYLTFQRGWFFTRSPLCSWSSRMPAPPSAELGFPLGSLGSMEQKPTLFSFSASNERVWNTWLRHWRLPCMLQLLAIWVWVVLRDVLCGEGASSRDMPSPGEGEFLAPLFRGGEEWMALHLAQEDLLPIPFEWLSKNSKCETCIGTPKWGYKT